MGAMLAVNRLNIWVGQLMFFPIIDSLHRVLRSARYAGACGTWFCKPLISVLRPPDLFPLCHGGPEAQYPENIASAFRDFFTQTRQPVTQRRAIR